MRLESIKKRTNNKLFYKIKHIKSKIPFKQYNCKLKEIYFKITKQAITFRKRRFILNNDEVDIANKI